MITLAIIGVVAALTIPTLITNYQKHQYVTQLKKMYSQTQNGFKSYMARQGVTKLSDTDLWTKINGNYTVSGNQTAFFNEFPKIFSSIKKISSTSSARTYHILKSSNNTTSNNPYNYLYFTDGSLMGIDCYKVPEDAYFPEAVKENNGKMLNYVCDIIFDVNGDKQPNRYGRDVFLFYLDNSANLFGVGSNDESLFMGGSLDYTWKAGGIIYGCETNTNSNSRGETCAARIIDEGWQMKY